MYRLARWLSAPHRRASRDRAIVAADEVTLDAAAERHMNITVDKTKHRALPARFRLASRRI
jgi:hypothetical protein